MNTWFIKAVLVLLFGTIVLVSNKAALCVAQCVPASTTQASTQASGQSALTTRTVPEKTTKLHQLQSNPSDIANNSRSKRGKKRRRDLIYSCKNSQ